MERGRGLLTAARAWLLAAALAGPAGAQTSLPGDADAAFELPPPTRAALDTVEDMRFDFDQAGFYAVVAFVKQSPASPGFREVPAVVDDWRDLLERPAAFRGRPVTIEGVVGRNRSYKLANYPELGDLWQFELSRADQPVACTAVFTENADDIPLGATIRFTGYFVLVRQYFDRSNRARQAVLLVAPGPTTVGRVVPAPPRNKLRTDLIFIAVVAGLLATWILLRRTARAAGKRDLHALRASHTAPLNLSDDLADWAGRDEDRPQGPRDPDA